jgi:hypothetical protein
MGISPADNVSRYICFQPVLRILNVYPGSRIQQQHQKKRGKIVLDLPFFVAKNIIKIVNNFIFEQVKEFFFAKTLIIISLFSQKLSLSYQKYGFVIRDPVKAYSGSRIPDLGSKRHRSRNPNPGSRIRIRNTVSNQ